MSKPGTTVKVIPGFDVEQDELNPNQMPLLPLPWELFPFRRGNYM
jgi:hypothetical protein